MMKRNILLFAIMLISISVTAQVKQEVIASAGGFNTSADKSLSISWTLGETIIPTFTSKDGSLILTHGFQQKYVITAIQENLGDPVQVNIYPNPTSDIINIQFETATDKEISLFLLDAQGKLVKSEVIEASVLNRELNLQSLPAGVYYLRLTKGKLVNVYKVVKL
jgi:hypothetical protein